MQLKEGANLQGGKYKIIRVLGQGGFGITYLAENALLEKRVAIKEFFPKDFCGRDATSHLTLGTQNNADTVARLKERFVKEAKNIAKLDHPGIVRIHDIFEENNTAYHVMDYIEGESLSDIVKRSGPLLEAKAVEYITKVGEALEYIHSRQMTHFDVKPANIMVRRSDDQPILIDFGLSKQYDTHGDATSTLMQAVSHGYSPIELYNLGSMTTFSPQTDVYSLGATLYYLLTGIVPSNASDLVEDRLSFPAGFPKNLQDAIEKAMSVGRKQRPESVRLFIERLQFKDEDTRPIVRKEITENSDSNESAQELYHAGEYYYTQKNYNTAFKYYLKAAKNGHAASQAKVGEMYERGEGVTSDILEAIRWYRRGADNGDELAQYNLGLCYEEGTGVAQDIKTAFIYYLKAARNGHAASMGKVGYMYGNGEGVTSNIHEAIKWYEKGAEDGDEYAQYNLGVCYEDGIGVAKDIKTAFSYYLKAAQNGHVSSMGIVGNMYEEGEGVTSDIHEAIKWYRKGAENGDEYAQYNLGFCYENGLGVSPDIKTAFSYYLKAAQNGHASSMGKIGYMYEEGEGVTSDIHEAIKWYEKGAENGDEHAQYNLGVCYKNGTGVTKDINISRKYYELSACQGFEAAMTALVNISDSFPTALELSKNYANKGFTAPLKQLSINLINSTYTELDNNFDEMFRVTQQYYPSYINELKRNVLNSSHPNQLGRIGTIVYFISILLIIIAVFFIVWSCIPECNNLWDTIKVLLVAGGIGISLWILIFFGARNLADWEKRREWEKRIARLSKS